MPGRVTDAMEHWATFEPERPAIFFRDDVVTYGDLAERARIVADVLEDRDLRPGDVVGIVGVNSVEWCVGSLGAILAGAVLAAYNHRFVAAELAKLVENSQPRIVLAGVEHLGRLAEVQGQVANFDVLSLGELGSLSPAADHDARSATRCIDVAPSDPALIVYTSGSTGTPKGVIFTHDTIHATVLESILNEGAVGGDSRRLGVLPMATAAGVFYNLLHQVIRGGALVLEPDFVAETALEAITRRQVTWISGPPIVFERLAQAEGFADADVSCVRYALVGGARVPAELIQVWHAKGVSLRQLYGSTEVGGIATVASAEEAIENPRSCGRGGILTKIRIVRPDGTECDTDEAGEILVKGPGCTPAYWRNPEATAELIVDGWLRSGDLGYRDEVGCYVFVDRLKDLIISGGLNIAPAEIEQVIGSYDGVLEVAVVPVDDDKFGEVPLAIIHADRSMDALDVVAHCRGQLADFKIPTYVQFEERELPRMPSGKLDKRALKQSYSDVPDRAQRVR